MRTPSLRRRLLVWTLATLTVLLIAVGVGVDLALGAVLKSEQRGRLVSLATLGSELTGLSDQNLANRLTMPGIVAVIRYSNGLNEVVGSPAGPPQTKKDALSKHAPKSAKAATAVISDQGGQLVTSVRLRADATLVLSTDSSQVDLALARFRLIMSAASVLALVLAALLLPAVLRGALRPLAALTAAARDTAGGDRGRRLRPSKPMSDIGQAAAQFDAMLEELEGAERRAELANDRLSRFLSDASHELRTPLAGISAGAERLVRDRMSDRDRERLAVQLVRESQRASRIVHDLLLVSRLGEVSLHTASHTTAELLRRAAERAATHLVRLAVEIEDDGTMVVLIDLERMEQVVTNLMTNAANAGAARMRMRTGRREGSIEIRISDDGPGVPVSAREQVFERLVRLDTARSAATGGSGLGLPIARGLAEAHGGALSLRDGAPGDLGGATFVLSLPGDTEVLGADASAAPTPRGSRVTASNARIGAGH